MKRLLCKANNNEEQDTYFLPNELWWTIFSSLSEAWQILNAPLVSKAWSALVRNEMKEVGHEFRSFSLNDALLARMPNLKNLRLSDGYKDFVSVSALALLSGVTRLHMTGNVGSFPTHGLIHMTRLEHLVVYWPVHMDLSVSTRLKTLKLRDSCSVVDQEIQCLTGLRRLTLRNCLYLTVECMTALTSLRHLDANVYGLDDRTLSLLTNLKSLKLETNSHTITDASLSKLTCLKRLSLDFPPKEITHETLLNLPALTHLTTWGIHPHLDVCRLVTLRRLVLHCNQSDIGDLSPLTNLVSLSMTGSLCLTKSLLASLVSLRELDVMHLVIHRAVTLGELRRLTKLWARGRDQRSLAGIAKLYRDS